LECLAFHSFGSSSYGLDWNSTFLVCCCVDFFFVLFYVCTAVVFSLNVAEIPLKMALNSNQSINYIGIGPLLQSLFRFQYSLFCTNHLMKQWNLKINVCCIALFVFVWYTLCCQFLWIVHIGLSFRYPLLFIKQENEKGFCEPLVINTRILANIALYVANYNQITKIPYNSSVESYRKSFNVIE
jgi:hypothetical protein